MSRTSLLIHCDGSSFVEETGRAVSVVGSPAISSVQYAALTGNATSGAFSSGTDLLSVPSHADFDFGSGDFTLECFLRVSSSGVNHGIINRRASNAVKGPFALYINTTGNIQFLASFNGTTWGVSLASPSNIHTATWYHIAITRRSDVWSMYQNGVLINSVIVAGTIMASTEPVRIGADSNGWGLNGYIDEIRVTKGMAMYNGAFTTPTDPFIYPDSDTVTFSGRFSTASGSILSFAEALRQSSAALSSGSVATFSGRIPVNSAPSLLLHMDTDSPFIDECGNAVTAVGNTVSSSVTLPFTTNNVRAAYFDGIGDYLSVANNTSLSFGSGEFTVEMWVKPVDFAAYQTIYAKRLTGSGLGPLQIRIQTDGYVNLYTSLNGSSGNLFLTASGDGTQLIAGEWSHIAVVRFGGYLYLFVNGITAASGALSGTLVSNTYPVLIGGDVNTYHFKGWIDEVRVVKGEAKYLGPFTPQTFPFSTGGVPASFSITEGSVASFAANGTSASDFYIPAASSISADVALVNSGTTFLLHLDGEDGSEVFIDECKNRVVGVGNARISTGKGKFSSQSLLLDGESGLEIHGTQPSFDIGIGEFLFEAWVYPTARSHAIIVDYGACGLYVLNNGHPYAVYHFIDGSSANVSLEYVQSIPIDAWTHLAFGIDWYGPALYVNGISKVVYANTGGALYADGINDWRIGIGNGFVGNIDEVRFTNGLNPYYSAFPIVTFEQQSPFRIPDSTSSAFFIYEGSSTSFVAPVNDPGLTSFSVYSGSTVDIKAVGILTVAREFNIDTGTTTHLDGWLLIGAESYFTVNTGSDFWFNSPSGTVSLPTFSIDSGSLANFSAPPQPIAKISRYHLALASIFKPKTEVRRSSNAMIWDSSTIKFKGRQNIPYVFSIKGISNTYFRGSGLTASRFSIEIGTALSLEACSLVKSRFDSSAQSEVTLNSRKLNGGAYAISSVEETDFRSDYGYLPPLPVIEAAECLFFRQHERSVNILTRIDRLHVREPV